MNVISYTLIALLAFAGNSILCRIALGENLIDASSFTAVRLLSGAIVLAIILYCRKAKQSGVRKGNWLGAAMLFIYAVTFSFAYIELETGTGALVLFGFVQITMILLGLYQGHKLHLIEWFGVLLAFSGLAYLMLPGAGAPPLFGFLLMMVSGIAWAIYTLLGKGSSDPLADTGYNFLRTLPFVLIMLLFSFDSSGASSKGILLAILSGAVASGLGYTVWYIALKGLTGTQAAVVQLSVPIIAALGGITFTEEVLSMRLGYAAILTLGGITAVIIGNKLSR